MMYNHPFAGTGWGDFFIDNMFYRTILENEEARTPHNVWLFFGSQAGVFALLIAMIATFYPIYLTIKSKENFLIMVSLIAFSIHSMIDVNSQISANMALYSVMLFMGARGVKNENFKWQLPKVIINTLLIIIAIASIILNLYNIVCEKRFDDFLNEVQPANNQLPNIYKVNMAYQKINKLKPFSPFHNASMYNFCLNFDKSSALTYLDKAIKNSPERASYYAQKAFYFQNINRMDSLKNIKKALYLYPLNTKYLQFLPDLEQ